MTVLAIQFIEKNETSARWLEKSKKIVTPKVKKPDYKAERGIEEFLFTAFIVCFVLGCAGYVAFYVLSGLYRMILG